LNRFMLSAKNARIDSKYSKDDIHRLIASTCAASGQKTAFVRFWLSAGGSDFSVYTKDASASLWIVVFRSVSMVDACQVVKEVTVPIRDVAIKPPMLANMKSTNYMLNTLTKMHATSRGAYNGLWVDENDLICESSVAAFIMIDKKGVVMTPKMDKILKSCTVERILEICELWKLSGDSLVKDVLICDVPLSTAYAAVEILIVSVDFRICSCISLDGIKIGTGTPGMFFQRVVEYIKEEMETGSAYSHPVPYELYMAK